MKAKLFTRIMNAPMEWLPETIRGSKKAVTYNFINGTGKKGNFEIYSFFDSNGKLVKRNMTYKNAGNTTREIKWYTPEQVKTAKSIDGKMKSFTSRNLYQNCFIETNILPEKGYDIHRFVKLKAGQKPQEISYKTAWDGNAPEIEYKDCHRILDGFEGAEFLPVLTAESSTKRINHIFLNQVKKQELQGIVPPIKIVNRKEAYKHSRELKAIEEQYPNDPKIAGFCDQDGQVYFINDVKSNGSEINNIAHEVQHAKDRSDIERLEHNTFFNTGTFGHRSRAKGIIKEKENPAEYKRISELEKSYNDGNYLSECLNGKHDDVLCEYYANKKGDKEFYKALNIFNKLNSFLFGS